jgi:Predicted secreted protein containing a PDZ domain
MDGVAAAPVLPAPVVGRSGPSFVTKLFLGFGALLVVAAIVGMNVTMPYVIFSPGDATGVDRYVHISGTRTYHHAGEVLLLTVRVSNGRPNLWRYLEATLDDDSKVIGEKQYLGNVPRKKADRASVQMMDESQLAAKQAALTRLGYTISVNGKGARVLEVVSGSPAARSGMRPDDVIVAIDGNPIGLRDQVGQIVQAHGVGTTFSVTVRRDGAERTLQVTSASAPSGPLAGKPYFGIGAGTEQLRVKFPVDITIDPGDVSGPSGGLAFTLTILDKLTPGNLTGGAKVAVTGEIDGAGNVGEVGGVPQKAVAAREAGAKLMIVPVPEVRDARSNAGGMKIVGVRTLDEALKVLHRNGGAAIPARSHPR